MRQSPEQKQYNPEEEFEHKKTKFFSGLALQLKESLRLHKEAGLWERKEGKRDWGNVSEHCLVEVARSKIFADWLGFSEGTEKNLMVAAALHDFNKRQEIQQVKKAIAEGKSNWDAFEESGEESKRKMEEAGFSETVIWLASSVGHTSFVETESILKKPELSEDELAYLVLHYTDEYTRGSEWAIPAETDEEGSKVNELDRRVDKNEANPNYDQLNEEGKAHFGGETTFQAQRRIGHEVENRLAAIINQKREELINPKDLPELIDQDIRAKIESEGIDT